MKKFIVLGLTAAAIIGIVLLSLTASKNAPMTSALSDSRERRSMLQFQGNDEGYAADDAPMPSMAPPPPPAAPGLGGLGLRGSGSGGGGKGMGIGGGRMMKEEAKADMDGLFGATEAKPLQQKRMNTIQVIRGQPPADEAEAAPAEAAPTRAWFPETFLFEPLITTDASGRANVPVKVPDRLTTWRVLALAHSREGSQAGTVASFLGTLPAYVDAVTPPFLYAGDVLKLPVQIVNTTESDLSSNLAFSAIGATLSSTGGNVRVPAGGEAVQFVTMTTTKPGNASFHAQLGTTDAVEKPIELKPQGRREIQNKAGTLAATRTFTLTGPANPLPGTEAVRVQIFPGALGLLRNELAAAPGRRGVAEDAYLLKLLGDAPSLLNSLGSTPDMPVIRDLSILATQRAMQYARGPSVDSATLLTEAALAHPGNPVLERLGERLALQVSQAQRPDGTCQGATGWTLQRLLVTTSDCVRAVNASTSTPQAKQRATLMTVRASGAFERNAARVTDGYTAAAILASGAVSGTTAENLRKLVLDGLQPTDDGGRFLKVESGIVRADGVAPSTYEATALAILALDGVKDAPVADLGTYLLSGYSAYYGWGDGRSNLVALRAVLKLFKDPMPASVKVTLERDGKPLASGDFDAAALKDVLSLDANAEGSGGAHEWSLRAEPAVPGLGFSLQLVSYAPWKEDTTGGMSLKTELPEKLKAGLPSEVKLVAAMPGGVPMKVDFSLPAGAQADSESLEKLMSAGLITRFETEDGLVTMHVPAQANGALWQAAFSVTPTLGGTLHSGASVLTPENNATRKQEFAPLTWKVD